MGKKKILFEKKVLEKNLSNLLTFDDNVIFDEGNLLDEDDMASDSATRPASQQSIKAYVDDNLGLGAATLAQAYAGDLSTVALTPATGATYYAMDVSSIDGTYTLPLLSSLTDKKRFVIYKYGANKCTVEPTGTDAVGDSGAGYGVESLDAEEASIMLMADNTNKKWHVISATGRWAVEGAKFHDFLTKASVYVTDSNSSSVYTEEIYKVSGYAQNGVRVWNDAAFGNSTGLSKFDGTNDYIFYNVDPHNAFDFFGSLTDSWTLSIWVKFDNATIATAESIVTQYEDASNLWLLERNASEQIRLQLRSGGVNLLDITSSAHADTNWHQIDIVKVDDDVAIYVDGVHEANGTMTAADTFAGSLYFGQRGDSAEYLDGSLADFYMVAQNKYGVDPTSALSTTTVRTQPAKLIYQ